jgi:hypothetical protein
MDKGEERRALVKEAGSPTTSPARLEELAAHPDEGIRRTVARNAGADAATVARLLDDASWEVRTIAAHHKRSPKDRSDAILLSLAESPEAPKRRLAARSPIIATELLLKLADDPDAETRSNAVKNPRIPAAVARAKLTDPEPSVVLGALAHPSVSKDERRAFLSEDLLTRFFEAHADGDHLFEALCERFLWDVLERAFADPERFDDTWQELVQRHFELVEIPSRNTMLAAVHRDHWAAVISRLADEVRGGARRPD